LAVTETGFRRVSAELAGSRHVSRPVIGGRARDVNDFSKFVLEQPMRSI
jgi:hypothetical protein